MKKKTRYCLRNWSDYNRSLEQRGSLTFWISEEAVGKWLMEEPSGGRGASRRYSEVAIHTAVVMKAIFHQAGRQVSGLLKSVFELMKIKLAVPDHSTVSRRLADLKVELPIKAATVPRHLVIDSTGVKVYGEGEWKVRTHGVSKRRTWRKLHLMIDAATHEIIVGAATTNAVADSQVMPEMLAEVADEIEQISGDGGYDRRKVYAAISDRKIKRTAIPPRRNARIWRHGNSGQERLIRDENLRLIRKHGRPKWKREAKYHLRSLAETAMFRYKTIFTDRLRARKEENQYQEMLIKCAVLNRMTHLGMPDSYKVAS